MLQQVPADTGWDATFGLPGTDGITGIKDMAVAPNGDLYIVGDFEIVGTVKTKSVAHWDAAAQSWRALGAGLPGVGSAIAIAGDGSIYASASNNGVQRWNATSATWEPLGSGLGQNATVEEITIDGSNVYVGGSFNVTGPVPLRNIAVWNGSAWAPLGNGLNNSVHTIIVAGGRIYAGGRFASSTQEPASPNGFGAWDGSSWQNLGPTSSTSIDVYALVYDAQAGVIYVGGFFTDLNRIAAADHVARYVLANGTYEALGTGVSGGPNYPVRALALIGNSLYAGGQLTSAGGTPANQIARFDLQTGQWFPLGSGLASADRSTALRYIAALAGNGTTLYVGGRFDSAGGIGALNIAAWDGSAWRAFQGEQSGFGSNVSTGEALISNGSELYAGGWFETAGGASSPAIARWSGSGWAPVGGGLFGSGGSIVKDMAFAADGSLYVAGFFSDTATVTGTTNIARWNPATENWSRLSSGLGNFGTFVEALAVRGNDLYAGGDFTTAGGQPANHIARWDGTNWAPLGQGTDAGVLDLALSERYLYVAGTFTTAGGVAAQGLARYELTTGQWSALPAWNPSVAHVNALAFANGTLYVGGIFSNAGGIATADYIAAFDEATSTWAGLGSGLSSWVESIVVSGNDLWVGGVFTLAGDFQQNLSRVARFNLTTRSWSPLGSGVNGSVEALAVHQGALFVTGGFESAGGRLSNNIGRWNIQGDGTPPTITSFTLSGEGSIVTNRTITLTTTAQDSGGSGPGSLYFIEWVFTGNPARPWKVTQTSNGWQPYADASSAFAWQLTDDPGIHYIAAYAADNAGNVSQGVIKFISYQIPTRNLEQGQLHLYRLITSSGRQVTVEMTALSGNPDLYVFGPAGALIGAPESDASPEVVRFTATASLYQVEVEGFQAGSYSLGVTFATPSVTVADPQATPAGRPRGTAFVEVGDEPRPNEAGLPAPPVKATTSGTTAYLPLVLR